MSIKEAIHKSEGQLTPDQTVNSDIIDLINRIYPLMFPLLEEHPGQGFMWGR